MAAGAVEAAIAAISALPDDTHQQPDSVLADRMAELARLRAIVDAALVEQLAVFDARSGANYDGQTSTQAWLRARLRMGGQVGDLVRVARQLSGLPHIAKAFGAGEISLEHAALVAKLATAVGVELLADYEPILLDLGRTATPAKLRTACDHLRQLLDPDGDKDQAARQRRHRHLTAGPHDRRHGAPAGPARPSRRRRGAHRAASGHARSGRI